jgi:MOSC domain-containing protein
MRLTSLRIYPVKSMAGIAVDTAAVEPWGLAGDRRWGVVDSAGQKVTARELHALLGLRAEPVDADSIKITDHEGSSVVVRTPKDGELVAVSHARQGRATLVDGEAHRWLSERLGQPVRLVWQHDPTARSIADDEGGRAGEHLSLADAGPLLLASEASMARLNSWISADLELPDVPDIDPFDLSEPAPQPPAHGRFEPLDILRFRPNVVIDGDEPFAEDGWARLRIGDVAFRTTMVCDRCVMTTIDPVTLAGGKEPIRTLARHRRWDRKTWFGTRLVPLASGVIRVGAPVVPAV